MTEQEQDSRGPQVVIPPLARSGLVGRFSASDLATFVVAVAVVYWGARQLPAWGWLLGAVLVAGVVACIPFVKPGGRSLYAFVPIAVGAMGDRLLGRGVYRGAVFAPESLAYRMDLPGDLAELRQVAVTTGDGISQVGLFVSDRKGQRTATAALLSFGSTALTRDMTEQVVDLAAYETVLESWCAPGAGIARYQLFVRTAPDVTNPAGRHAMESARIRSGPVWENTRELITGPAADAQRYEVYLVVAFDLGALQSEIEEIDKNWSDDAVGAIVLTRMAEVENAIAEAGITTRGWLRPGQYAGVLHTQLDPTSLPVYDVLGNKEGDIDPHLAGPAAAERTWRYYRHDGAVSQTLWVHTTPGRPVGVGWLAPVLLQTGVRRAFSFVAQPLEIAAAERQVARQAGRAEGAIAKKNRRGVFVPARVRKEAQSAEMQNQQLADGGGLHRYHLFITVTADNETALNKDVLAVRRRLHRAGLGAMILYGEQDQAFFAGGLPLARGLQPLRFTDRYGA